jgi:hypothetical protein
MSGGGDFVQRGEENCAKIEINVLNLRGEHARLQQPKKIELIQNSSPEHSDPDP